MDISAVLTAAKDLTIAGLVIVLGYFMVRVFLGFLLQSRKIETDEDQQTVQFFTNTMNTYLAEHIAVLREMRDNMRQERLEHLESVKGLHAGRDSAAKTIVDKLDTIEQKIDVIHSNTRPPI